MSLWCVHARTNGFLLKSSFLEKPVSLNSRIHPAAFEIRVSRKDSFSKCCRFGSLSVKAVGKRDSDSDDFNANSSSSSPENSNHSKAGGDGLKENSSSRSNKSGDSGSQETHHKPLDWREFRSLLYSQEQAENVDSVTKQEQTSSESKSSPLKWAHPLSEPENGCLLVATEKLDGVRTFERTVVLLLRSGTRNPQEGPFGIVINRPLNKKMKHMNPTNRELATTFSDCSLHFGGPLDASMFLVRARDTAGISGLEEVIGGLHFGSRNSLGEASVLVKKGKLTPKDFRFFMGYAGWQVDQLREEIESEYWHVAACSENMIFGDSKTSSPDGLWEEILQLMGGRYSELSRKPKQDIQ